jgi:hypothetical protein
MWRTVLVSACVGLMACGGQAGGTDDSAAQGNLGAAQKTLYNNTDFAIIAIELAPEGSQDFINFIGEYSLGVGRETSFVPPAEILEATIYFDSGRIIEDAIDFSKQDGVAINEDATITPWPPPPPPPRSCFSYETFQDYADGSCAQLPVGGTYACHDGTWKSVDPAECQ